MSSLAKVGKGAEIMEGARQMLSQKVITDTRRQKEKIGRKKRTRIDKQMVDR